MQIFFEFWSQLSIHLEVTYNTYIRGEWGCHLTHTEFLFLICACISFNYYKICWCHIILVWQDKCELKWEARAHCLIQHTSAVSQLFLCLHQSFPVIRLFFLWCFFLLLFLLIVCLHQNIPAISYTSEFSSLLFFFHISTFHSPSTRLLLKTNSDKGTQERHRTDFLYSRNQKNWRWHLDLFFQFAQENPE